MKQIIYSYIASLLLAYGSVFCIGNHGKKPSFNEVLPHDVRNLIFEKYQQTKQLRIDETTSIDLENNRLIIKSMDPIKINNNSQMNKGIFTRLYTYFFHKQKKILQQEPKQSVQVSMPINGTMPTKILIPEGNWKTISMLAPSLKGATGIPAGTNRMVILTKADTEKNINEQLIVYDVQKKKIINSIDLNNFIINKNWLPDNYLDDPGMIRDRNTIRQVTINQIKHIEQTDKHLLLRFNIANPWINFFNFIGEAFLKVPNVAKEAQEEPFDYLAIYNYETHKIHFIHSANRSKFPTIEVVQDPAKELFEKTRITNKTNKYTHDKMIQELHEKYGQHIFSKPEQKSNQIAQKSHKQLQEFKRILNDRLD